MDIVIIIYFLLFRLLPHALRYTLNVHAECNVRSMVKKHIKA